MRTVICATIVSAMMLSVLGYTQLPPPYDEIVDPLPFNSQGWYSNAASMEWLMRRGNVKTVIEIGCWLGSSTRHIAQFIPEDGVVYAIDHWLGSPNEDNSVFDMENLYKQFLSNVIHTNLTHKIIPIRMSSTEAALLFSMLKKMRIKEIKPDLIYIDATHDFNNVYQDLVLWFPFVKGHGTLCGDDYFWDYDPFRGPGPVMRAVDTFARENQLQVQHDGWMWYLIDNPH